MKLRSLHLICLFQALATVAFAAVIVEMGTENPEHPGKCWLDQYNRTIDIGADWRPEGVVNIHAMVISFWSILRK